MLGWIYVHGMYNFSISYGIKLAQTIYLTSSDRFSLINKKWSFQQYGRQFTNAIFKNSFIKNAELWFSYQSRLFLIIQLKLVQQ